MKFGLPVSWSAEADHPRLRPEPAQQKVVDGPPPRTKTPVVTRANLVTLLLELIGLSIARLSWSVCADQDMIGVTTLSRRIENFSSPFFRCGRMSC
jgi:hypothetical protein